MKRRHTENNPEGIRVDDEVFEKGTGKRLGYVAHKSGPNVYVTELRLGGALKTYKLADVSRYMGGPR